MSETIQNKKAENTSQNSSSSSGHIFFFQLLNEGSPIKRWASASLPVMSSFTHPFASRMCLFFLFVFFFIFYFLSYFTTSIRREKFWQDRQTHTARLRKCVCSVVCSREFLLLSINNTFHIARYRRQYGWRWWWWWNLVPQTLKDYLSPYWFSPVTLRETQPIFD